MNGDPRPVVKCDKLTMRIIETYQSAREAARVHGIPHGNISVPCSKKVVSKGSFVWRYADEYDPDESFEGKFNRPVAMYDSYSEAASIFDNLTEAAKSVGYSNAAVSNSMSAKTMLGNRYVFKYAR